MAKAREKKFATYVVYSSDFEHICGLKEKCRGAANPQLQNSKFTHCFVLHKNVVFPPTHNALIFCPFQAENILMNIIRSKRVTFLFPTLIVFNYFWSQTASNKTCRYTSHLEYVF